MNEAKPAEPVSLLIVIPYWDGDIAMAKEMVKLIADLQPDHAKREAEILLVNRQDCKADPGMIACLKSKFNVHTLKSFSPMVGWPQGCNGMFGSAMIHVSQNMPVYGGVFWMEADCTPMRPSWHSELAAAWRARKPLTKVMGWIGDCNGDGTGFHITGCAVYDTKIAQILPDITMSCIAPWDYEHRNLIMGVGEKTTLIENCYRRAEPDPALLESGYAVVHGFKNDSLLKMVREKNLTKS